MQRTKIAAVAVATLVALSTALVLFTGGAAAAQWHEYEGDLHAGHAYGFIVPADAEAIELSFADEGAGEARFALFDPAGEMIGHYTLGASPTTATVADPVEGRHVVYVYEVRAGALLLRVSAAEAPELDLSKVPLAREDVVLATYDTPQALDQVITTKLDLTPVFATLLYEGSAEDLDATVASTRGTIVTIEDETATAFSPGVWAAQTGIRTMQPENLASGAYTVTARAASFEGTLVLTSLALDLARADETVDEPALPPVEESDPALFPLHEGEAVAAWLPAGQLVIADGEWLEDQAEHADEETHERHYRSWYGFSLVTVYTPDDEVLGVVTLDGNEPVASIELPVEGEYVLYTMSASNDLFARAENALVAPEVRTLELQEATFEFVTNATFEHEHAWEFEVAQIPVTMELHQTDGVTALQDLRVENENGAVADSRGFVGGSPLHMAGCPHVMPENFAVGLHTLHANGFSHDAAFEVVVVSYLREAPVLVEEVVPAEEAEPQPEEGSEEEQEEDEIGRLVDEILDLLPF